MEICCQVWSLFIYLNRAMAIHPSFSQNSVTASYNFYKFYWDCINIISYFYEQMLFCGAFPSILFPPCFFFYLNCWFEGHLSEVFLFSARGCVQFYGLFIASAPFSDSHWLFLIVCLVAPFVLHLPPFLSLLTHSSLGCLSLALYLSMSFASPFWFMKFSVAVQPIMR